MLFIYNARYFRQRRQCKQPFPLLFLIQSTENEKNTSNMWMNGFELLVGYLVGCQSK